MPMSSWTFVGLSTRQAPCCWDLRSEHSVKRVVMSERRLQRSLAHLPDSSEELAAMADVEITLEGCALPLHRVTLASGSRVLRTALCSCSGSVSASAAARSSEAAAVQAAFEGHSLLDVQLFLSILYDPMTANHLDFVETNWDGLLGLAVKLDAQAVLQVTISWTFKSQYNAFMNALVPNCTTCGACLAATVPVDHLTGL